MNYWASGYWHANYWHSDFWGEYVDPSQGDYWHENYWHNNYWASGYWAEVVGDTTTISQVATPSMSMTAQIAAIDISLEVVPNTPTMTLTAQNVAASNNVTVEQVSTPTMTMSALNVTQDAGEYYVADVSFSVFMASSFDFTDTMNATAPTMTMSSNNADIKIGDAVVVGVTSTPTMTMSALPTQTTNNVLIQPATPTMTMTGYSVQTGFGTLVDATVPSMSMSTLQTNVTGTNADLNHVDATLASMMLTELNTVVVGTSIPEVSSTRGRRKRKVVYTVTVDGQTFQAQSVAEVEDILEQLAEIAEETPVQTKPKIKVVTARGKKPTSKPLLKKLAQVRERIDSAVETNVIPMTPIDKEIAQLMQAALERELVEDDDAILALLIM